MDITDGTSYKVKCLHPIVCTEQMFTGALSKPREAIYWEYFTEGKIYVAKFVSILNGTVIYDNGGVGRWPDEGARERYFELCTEEP